MFKVISRLPASFVAWFALCASLAGCTAGPLTLPAPLDAPPDSTEAQAPQAKAVPEDGKEPRTSPTPKPPGAMGGYTSGTEAALPPLPEDPVSLTVENLPLPAFVNEVYGDVLGLDFTLDPKLARSRDQVTLRISEPQPPRDLYRIASQVLAQYGVVIEPGDGVLLFTASSQQTVEKPLLVSGRALPDVPPSQRPVFQLVQLRAVFANDVLRWLNEIYGRYGLDAKPDLKRNAIMLSGKDTIVRDAVEALDLLDRPFMRGRNGLRFNPMFIKAGELADQLIEVLRAQGYAAAKTVDTGAGSLVVLPVPSANILLLFSSDAALLQHARDWAEQLDAPRRGSGQTFFIYDVQNTRADSIVSTINQLLSAEDTGMAESGAQSGARGNVRARSGGRRSGLVVDEGRNALIFQGEAARWEELSTIIRALDRPPKQVLIEVTIAEVTLTGQESFGVEWVDTINGNSITFNPTSGGVGGLGLTYSVLDSAGATKAVLNAFASDSRVNILSTPRVLVQSGQSARVDVGTEVPIITSQSEGTDTTARITQEVQYRKTGLILEVSPVMHSGNRVDMTVSVENSEALPLSADAAINSPSIFTRFVDTSLSLDDGGSVLIAGLITNRETNSDGGVPLLKDIPLLGGAFSSRSRTTEKTELVVMIVPYVVESGAESRALTESILERFRQIQ
jgi:general secretion pathway protein D